MSTFLDFHLVVSLDFGGVYQVFTYVFRAGRPLN